MAECDIVDHHRQFVRYLKVVAGKLCLILVLAFRRLQLRSTVCFRIAGACSLATTLKMPAFETAK